MGDSALVQRPQSQRHWNEAMESLTPGQLRALQWEKLQRQIRYNYTHSPFYQRLYDEAGVRPDDVQTWDDFTRLPVWGKDLHRQVQAESRDKHGDPYYMMGCAPRDQYVCFSSTSGTTGTPTLYTVTRNDRRIMNELHARKFWRAGLRPGDIVINAFSLSMFGGGLMCDGLMEYGVAAVPVGADTGTRRILEFARLTRATAMLSTPSLAEHLIERSPEILGCPIGDLGIKTILCGGEPGAGIPALKEKIESSYGARVFDFMGGVHPLHAISCPDGVYRGMHLVSGDYIVIELVHPETQQIVPFAEGAVGELIFTFLDWEGGPLMRYRFGDVIQVHTDPCPCGLGGIRYRLLGRGDDMLIVKGVNIYPAALKNAVVRFSPRTTGFLRIVLDAPGPRVQPPLQLEVEYGPGLSQEELAQLDRDFVKFCKENYKVSPKVSWLPPGSIDRVSHKTKLVVIRP